MIFSNLYVVLTTRKNIVPKECAAKEPADYILVLGASIWPGNVPCPILQDRLLTGIELYCENPIPFLMSGGCKDPQHDEPAVMKHFAMKRNVPERDIFTDPFGINTYASLVRAKEQFHAKRLIIITQKYHIYRALYMARILGLNAVGVCADKRRYRKPLYREFREFAARIKYVLMGIRIFMHKKTDS